MKRPRADLLALLLLAIACSLVAAYRARPSAPRELPDMPAMIFAPLTPRPAASLVDPGGALQGPGIVMQMTDSTARPGPDDDPYFFVVHDQDLQAAVFELFAAGAEAVSINNQRIQFPGSSLRCIGTSIVVNNHELKSPFVIRAIGPGPDMGATLRESSMVHASISPLLDIPATLPPTEFRYARPVP